MKLFIEFFPIIVLFGLYKAYNIQVATAGFMVALVVILLWKYWQTKKWDKFLLATSIVGLVMGGLTLYFDNPEFLQQKPTVVYAMLIAFFWISYAFFNKNWIAALYEKMVTITEKTAKTLLFGTIFFFALMLVVNEILVFTVNFDMWLTIKTWGFMAATFVFAMWQGWMVMRDPLVNIEELAKKQEQLKSEAAKD